MENLFLGLDILLILSILRESWGGATLLLMRLEKTSFGDFLVDFTYYQIGNSFLSLKCTGQELLLIKQRKVRYFADSNIIPEISRRVPLLFKDIEKKTLCTKFVENVSLYKINVTSFSILVRLYLSKHLSKQFFFHFFTWQFIG